jgi:DNA-binding MarR family transcriptional regulator
LNQFSLLDNLKKIGVSTVSGLADYVGLDGSTVVRGLKPLLKAGYIEDVSEVGKRDHQIQVTKRGLETLDAATPLWEQAQSGVVGQIGEDGLETLTKLLSLIEML